MVSEATIQEAGRLLAAAARPPARVILFGSHARGEAGPHSDLDFLVIEPLNGDKLAEMVRLRVALTPLPIAADVVVVDETYADEWRDVHGSIVHSALKEGRVLAETHR